MRTIRLILTFYKSFAFASLMITLSCVTIIYAWGLDAFAAVFWFKIATLAVNFYYINSFKKDVYFYYKNLGVTKKRLWISTLSFDLILFVLLMTITYKIR
ncbi:hypothetical protein EYV94_01035 [Puteibacter caeruleilacunae]|nr:hypothetical protein EYV94_01035 [Puteibacter caeruleilacunae]